MSARRRPGRVVPLAMGIAVGVAGLAMGVLPTTSAQASVGCGAVITASTTIASDLSCTSGDGLVITASGITVDLKGHAILGSPGTVAAIRINPGVHGVTVQNGTLVGFDYGVVVDSADDNRITNLRVFALEQGVLLANSENNLIDKNVVSAQYRDGIKVDGNGNRIIQNKVTNSAFGVSVSNGSTGNVVSQNVLSGNRDFGVAVFDGAGTTAITRNTVSGSAIGISVKGGATMTTVAQNTVSGAGEDGIGIAFDSNRTLVSQNSSFGNGDDGIDVRSSETTIIKNKTYGNGDAGIVAIAGVTDGGGNVAYDNGTPCSGVVCAAS